MKQKKGDSSQFSRGKLHPVMEKEKSDYNNRLLGVVLFDLAKGLVHIKLNYDMEKEK